MAWPVLQPAVTADLLFFFSFSVTLRPAAIPAVLVVWGFQITHDDASHSVDEWSGDRRDLYLTNYNSQNRPTCMLSAEFIFLYPIINRSTVEPRFTNAPVHEHFGSRTNFPSKKTSRMTNGVSDYENASWQQRQAKSIGAGVSVAG
jgi:hypothetical protein